MSKRKTNEELLDEICNEEIEEDNRHRKSMLKLERNAMQQQLIRAKERVYRLTPEYEQQEERRIKQQLEDMNKYMVQMPDGRWESTASDWKC